MQTLHVKTERKTQLVDVTAQVQKAVAASGVGTGICYLYVPHTTAAITINECADPDVARDVKSVLVGASQIIHVEGGKLVLGRWEGVFFCEFDGPRDRRLQVKIVGD
jgi:thiamine phosphate synthase YjbQ (UPF0047 family)